MRKQSAFMNVVVRRFAGAARRFDPRPSESLPSSPSIRGNAVAAPPAFSKQVRRRPLTTPRQVEDSPAQAAWPQEDGANEPSSFFARGESNSFWASGARVAIAMALLAAALSSPAAVREVGAIGLTVGNIDREVEFFTKVLLFEKISESKPASTSTDELLGLNGTKLRVAQLRLGDERVTLTEHLTNKGS